MITAPAVTGLVAGVVIARVQPGQVADRLATDDPLQAVVFEPNRFGSVALASDDLSLVDTNAASIRLPNVPLSDVGVGQVRILLRGNRNQTITIVDMHVRIIHKGPPVAGWIAFEGPGGGPDGNIDLSVNLDEAAAQFIDINTSKPYFGNTHITLKNDETAVTSILASANNAYYAWDVQIDYFIGDRENHLIVNRKGILRTRSDPDPFELSAFTAASHYKALFTGSFVDGTFYRVSAADFCGGGQTDCTYSSS